MSYQSRLDAALAAITDHNNSVGESADKIKAVQQQVTGESADKIKAVQQQVTS